MDPAALPPQTLDPELPSLFAAAAPLDSSLPPMQIGGLGSTQELFTPSSASRRVAAESEQVVGSPQELCAPSPPSLGALSFPSPPAGALLGPPPESSYYLPWGPPGECISYQGKQHQPWRRPGE